VSIGKLSFPMSAGVNASARMQDLPVAPLNAACSAVMTRVEHRTLSAHACSAVRPASQPAAGHDLLLVEVAAAAGPHCFRVEIYSASQMRHLDSSGRLHLPQPLPR